jgi:hypothetical protein
LSFCLKLLYFNKTQELHGEEKLYEEDQTDVFETDSSNNVTGSVGTWGSYFMERRRCMKRTKQMLLKLIVVIP